MKNHTLSGSWDTPMKEIIKGAIIKHPALRGQVTLVVEKKSRVLVMLLKFNQRKIVSLRECAKLFVITFAGRPRNTLLIVKLSGHWHTEQERPRVNPRQ